jgi:NADP-dependent 3-hydroxy acid dehydrogenase YdfG
MAKEPKNLSGKVAAITGGARGIGLATAKAMSGRGMRVSIGDLDADLAQQAAEELGGGAIATELDVTDRESFEAFVDETERSLGPLDVLVNNAGIMPVGPFLEETDETAHRQIDINVHGVIYGMKIAIPRMIERGSGHVVNVASAAGKGGFPGIATYCAGKHAVVGVSEAVRGETRDTGVELSVIMPTFVNTELISGAQKARFVKVPEPEDVADAIVDAIEHERFDVWVPRETGGINKFMQILPRRGREAVARLLKADTVLTEIDEEERAAYEKRIARATASEREREEGADERERAEA